jgi:protein TonB
MRKSVFLLCLLVIASNIFAQDSFKLAVVDFEMGSGISQSTANEVTKGIIDYLNYTRKFAVPDRESTNKAFQEQSISKSVLNNNNLIKIAKTLDIDYILIGSLSFDSEVYHSDVRIVHIFHDQIMTTSRFSLNGIQTTRKLIDDIVTEIIEKVEVERESHPITSRPAPQFVVYDEAPVLLKRVQPEYPEYAKEHRIQGHVVLEIEVLPSGTIGEINVLQSQMPEFSEAAIEAAKQWQYHPARIGGKPVSCKIKQVFTFELPAD